MDYEKEITDLKDRNTIVDANKAWETSRDRIGVIVVLTYVIAYFVFKLIDDHDWIRHYPTLQALLPAIGYFVSTRSFPSPKSWWIEYQFGITAKDSAGKRLRKHAWPTLIRRTLALPRLLFTRGSSAPRG